MSDPPLASTSDLYLSVGAGDAWSKEAAAQGSVGSQQLISVETVLAPTAVAKGLDLGPGDRVVVRRRLMLLDGQPIELVDSFYPESLAGGTVLAAHRKIPGGAVAALAMLGHKPISGTDHVSAREPMNAECELLSIAETDWLLVLVRIARDASGRPVEYSDMRSVARLSSGHTYQILVGRDE